MVFGKRKLPDLSSDAHHHEYDDTVSDEGDVAVTMLDGLHNSNTRQAPVQAQSQHGSKPLLSEVDIVGVVGGKNPGGTKKWVCKHCDTTYKST